MTEVELVQLKEAWLSSPHLVREKSWSVICFQLLNFMEKEYNVDVSLSYRMTTISSFGKYSFVIESRREFSTLELKEKRDYDGLWVQ